LVATLKGGGVASFQGWANAPPAPPPNETLTWMYVLINKMLHMCTLNDVFIHSQLCHKVSLISIHAALVRIIWVTMDFWF
jgi:hypothetical protein